MTKEELLNDIRNNYLKFCRGKKECYMCPYDNKQYLDCEILFTISYLNKRHLLKGIEREDKQWRTTNY